MREPTESPDLPELIEELIENRLYELNTAFPGTIQKVDAAQGLVDVQSDFKRLYVAQEEPVTPPVIKGVPLWQYRAGTAWMNMPVKVGDRVLVICSQRSLDKWKRNGAQDTPGSSRIHSVSDAIAIPGLYPVSDVFPIADNLTVQYGSAIIKLIENEEIAIEVTNAKLRLTKDGKISVSNGTVELVDLIIQGLTALNATIDLIKAITVPTSLGPSGVPINAAGFDTQKQSNQKIIDKMTKLKR